MTISVAIATSQDIPDLLNFMLEDFLETNNLNRPISLSRDDAHEAYEDLVIECVHSGTSLVLRNSEGEVVAMRLSTYADRSTPEKPIFYPTRIQTIFEMLTVLTKDKWVLIPQDVEKVLYIEILSVAKKYRRQGLAKILTSIGFETAINSGATGVMAESTSVASQTLFAKLGFSILRELPHSEFVNADGCPVFAPLADGATAARFVFKRLI